MSKTLKYIGKVTEIKQISSSMLYVKIEHREPTEMNFEPGQFVSVKVAEDTYRAYSICSNPEIKNYIELVLQNKREGTGASYLNNLKINDEVEYIGPSGIFLLSLPYSEKMFFFATGTGITPFVSMFKKLISEGEQNKIKLFWGVRFKDNIPQNLVPSIIDTTYYISRENIEDFEHGRITDTLTELDFNNSDVYLCGNKNMITDIKDYLNNKNFTNLKIHTEVY